MQTRLQAYIKPFRNAICKSGTSGHHDFDVALRKEQNETAFLGMSIIMTIFTISFPIPRFVSFWLWILVFVYTCVLFFLIYRRHYFVANLLTALLILVKFMGYVNTANAFVISGVRIGDLIILLALTGSFPWVFGVGAFMGGYFYLFCKPTLEQQLLNMTSTEVLEVFRIGTTGTERAMVSALLFIFIYNYRREKLVQKLHRQELKLKEKTEQLEGYTKLLQTTIQEKEDFILNFSHELRNPLNGLLGNLELAIRNNTHIKTNENLRKAKICSEILENFLTSILDSSKAENGKLEVSETAIDTKTFFERIWTVAADLIAAKRLKGYFNLSCRVPKKITIDSRRLTQIILNLVGNAVKFTDEGMISVTITWISHKPNRSKSAQEIDLNDQISEFHMITNKTPRDSVIGVRNPFDYFTLDLNKTNFLENENLANSDEGDLVIMIGDSGCGIPQEKLPQLFKKFSQVNTSSEKRKLGAGLGLWITKNIIEVMQGDIKVNSREQNGTVFTVRLPSKLAISRTNSSSGEPSLQSRGSEIPARKKLRAMVVDDLPYNQTINVQLLEKLGVEVSDLAENGSKAVSLYCNRPSGYYDLITMDINMPVMNGKDACREIRAYETSKGWKPVPIVIISGNCSKKETKECLDVKGDIRANFFVEKPCGLPQLGKIVNRLNKKQLKVLICDDQKFNVDLLEDFVREQGATTYRAYDGLQALEIVKGEPSQIDVIFIDYYMPNLDGISACKRFFEIYSQAKKKPKIYLLSGDDVPLETKKELSAAGLAGILRKPVTINEIQSLLNSYN